MAVFIALAALAIVAAPRLRFDSDPLHTKNPNTEAMRTLYDLMDNPVTNPYTIDILSPNVAAAEALKLKLVKVPTVAKAINIQSFVPDDQKAKLAIIADANSILSATLLPLHEGQRRRSHPIRYGWRQRARWRRSIPRW